MTKADAIKKLEIMLIEIIYRLEFEQDPKVIANLKDLKQNIDIVLASYKKGEGKCT